jgi:hypothetical protein
MRWIRGDEVNVRLLCKQRVVVVLGTAAVAAVDLTPPVGHAYVITSAYGFHNEGAPLQCLWAMDDGRGGGFRDLVIAAALASGAFTHLYDGLLGMRAAQPLVLRATQSLRFNAAGISGAHLPVIVAILDDYAGETPYDG